ncbi:Ig-like domain-containing protein [Actinoplanes derwentensis]|uniref:Ig-like domain (Group 3) n=1 Tax=Actinoplanes derwentensis TaxID=113562 RepID=A0A1H2CW92_9ACTN|nr:Ig-like domain-containing protein [Actinoplanes derwentensis]GID88370.1 hypothetical protein Ade03nite_72940 [Actinoplanes derwentensis]SDT74731.1 Ig-like domain (group 3) [Actinoplanes derwentensis]
MGDVLGIAFRWTGFVTATVLAASFGSAVPAVAADAAPRVFARVFKYPVGGVTPVTFETFPDESLSGVTSLTVYAAGRVIGTDTEAPWLIDWDTAGFDGQMVLYTVATTATGSSTTAGEHVRVDNKPPSPTVVFPRRDGYIGRGGELTVDATDDVYAIGSELIVNGQVISSRDARRGERLDLRWNITVPNGRTPMTIRVWDEVGNVSTSTRTVTVDNDRPVITGTTTAGSAIRGAFKVSLGGYRDASPFSGFEASLFGAKRSITYIQENSRTVTIDSRDAPDGKYTLGWHAYDAAGNKATLTRPLIVDHKRPTISITSAPKNKAQVKTKFKIKAKASDVYGVSKVQLLINGKVVQTDSTAGYAFTVNPKKYGTKFTVRIRAYDRAGNVRYSPTRTYRR